MACFAKSGFDERDIPVQGNRNTGQDDDDLSESIRGLTSGVIMVQEEFEVRFEERVSRDGSSDSSRL